VIAYLVRRLVLAASIVVTVSFAGFVGFGLSFDPAYSLVTDPEKHDFVRRHYHLNDPILSQYLRWVTGLFHHGFGTTVSTDVLGTVPPRLATQGTPIGPAVWQSAAITFELVGAAMLFVVLGSVAVGALTARRQRLHADLVLRALTYLGASVPTFLVGDLLLRAISPKYIEGPGGNITTTGSWFVLGPPTGGLVDWFQHMTLPVSALAVSLIGVYARYVRSSTIEALGEPYVAVARAKGLPERTVMLRHVLRTSLVPFTSLVSLEFGAIIGASLAADAVFNLGGLASTFLGAVHSSDPFELTALFVSTAVVVSAFTLAGDLLVGLMDPRVTVAGT